MNRKLGILIEMKKEADELKASPSQSIQSLGFDIEEAAKNLIFTFAIIEGKTGGNFDEARRRFEEVFGDRRPR